MLDDLQTIVPVKGHGIFGAKIRNGDLLIRPAWHVREFFDTILQILRRLDAGWVFLVLKPNKLNLQYERRKNSDIHNSTARKKWCLIVTGKHPIASWPVATHRGKQMDNECSLPVLHGSYRFHQSLGADFVRLDVIWKSLGGILYEVPLARCEVYHD